MASGAADMTELPVLTEERAARKRLTERSPSTSPHARHTTHRTHAQERYDEGEIYSSVGSILLALNPQQPLSRLYGEQLMLFCQQSTEGKAPCPHIYTSVERIYKRVTEGEGSQSLIISGESGAGKTESAKVALSYLVWRTSEQQRADGRMQELATGLRQANPLMEAMGNAATPYNANSSRFGRCTSLRLDPSTGEEGAARLLAQDAVAPDDFSFGFSASCEAMVAIGFRQEEQTSLFAALATLLHLVSFSFSLPSSPHLTQIMRPDHIRLSLRPTRLLAGSGNVQFDEIEGKATPRMEEKQQALRRAAHVLSQSMEEVTSSLTRRSITIAGGEAVGIDLRSDQAEDSLLGLLKSIYSLLFAWVVERLNHTLATQGGTTPNPGWLSHAVNVDMLDIFGFENFSHNCFEQELTSHPLPRLCINYANEALHQVFLATTFKAAKPPPPSPLPS
ncbi:MAG: hypothetical protein SGPRY_006940 [Prymnesium sp.]